MIISKNETLTLHENKLMWLDHAPKELYFIVKQSSGKEIIGRVTGEDFTYADLEDLLFWNGLTKKQWDNTPPKIKVSDTIQYLNN